ncbi:MAG: hypothetical protein IJ553_03340 [Alloprevotella sp.]|nr:hypothetical protein [Alloprevotella sp.]
MKNLLRNTLIALSATLTLASCNDTDDYHGTFLTTDAAIIINQGNQYDGIAGTMGVFDTHSMVYSANIFEGVNGQSLGDTPQNAIVHGSKVYLPVFGSNVVWVLDKNTNRIVHTINTNQPEWVDAYKNYLYIANNDGFVTRVDTATWATTQLAVGPNPACLVVTRNAVYVTISDGYNYANNYADGKKVVKINLDGFVVEKEIPCGLNPGKIVANSYGQIFLVARGNYKPLSEPDRVPSMIQEINGSDVISATGGRSDLGFTLGMDLAVSNNYLYVIEGDYNNDGTLRGFNYKVFNALGMGLMTDDKFSVGDRPACPTGIFVDPVTSLVYITSDPSLTGYNQQGSVWIFNYDGALLHHFDAGIHPYAVAFVHGSITQ